MTKILDHLYDRSQPTPSEEDLLNVPFLLKHAPNLHDFMRFEYWNGQPVQTPTLQFVVERGALWIKLSDREGRRTFSTEIRDIASGIELLEGYITDGSIKPHWRAWPGEVKGKGKNQNGCSTPRTGTSKASRSTGTNKRTSKKAST